MSTFKTKYIPLLLILLTGLTSCVADFFEPESIGEGEAMLRAEVDFSPVLNALDRTRANGESIKHINSLCVIIYDANGNLFRRVPQNELENLEILDNDKMTATTSPGDALTDGDQAEAKTPKATFSIKGIPFGRYQIYAVANMDNLEKYSDDDIATADQLKQIPLTWDPANISKNDQMFGYFTPMNNMESEGFGPVTITVNSSNMPLHAWIKRAASKVTVAVDGSQLNEGVRVWIKSIQVRDIAEVCYLGQNNTSPAHLIDEGGAIVVSDTPGKGEADDFNIVTKHHNYPADIADAHTETAEALFFYENMQGTGQNKAQAWTAGATTPEFPGGNNPTDPGYKDGKRNGTYVEVIGYYENDTPTPGKAESGYIIYRFMLGKNTSDNYDAQRNYHYKLTLMLKNNAWDTDWHIVYNPKPDIILPDPYYISYLYNQEMSFPFKTVGGKLTGLQVVIEDNDVNKNCWAPYNCNEPDVYWTGAVNDPGPWNGYLRLTKSQVSQYGMVVNPETGKVEFGSGNPATYTNNKTLWTVTEPQMGNMTYDVSDGAHDVPGGGEYTIKSNTAGETEITIPFFTNARVMTEQTAYSGNNPFSAYMRNTVVTIIAKITDADNVEHTITKTTNIRQARRIVNPTGIWRDANSTKEFHIQLKILEKITSKEFTNLHSDGPWMAVIKCGDWFDLIPTEGVSTRNADGTISGLGDQYDPQNAGTVIDFSFKPKNKNTSGTPRGGIIKIYYNNFSCIHLIYVRQGYDPVSFDGTTFWPSYNTLTSTSEVSDPAAEGSYFRQYNEHLPIAASNNTFDRFDMDGAPPFTFAIQGSTNHTWPEITCTDEEKTGWKQFTVNGKNMRLPLRKDWDPIIKNDNINYGFGVLYTDNTNNTVESVDDAYGAREGDTNNKGMRGVFVCDTVSGTQIFLPIGASGYGRFKQQALPPYDYRQRPGYMGVIQYANRYKKFSSFSETYGVTYKPLFEYLYRSEGALYWLGDIHPGGKGGYAIDINYYSLNLRYSDLEDLGIYWPQNPDPSGTDAIMMRLVYDKQ